MILNFEDLTVKAKNIKKQRLAVAGAADKTVIEAVYRAEKLGTVYPLLYGDEVKIKELLQEYPMPAAFFGTASEEEAARQAVAAVRAGAADFLMKGMVDTGVLLKAVLNRDSGIRGTSLLSDVAVFAVPDCNRLLIASDCAMVLAPSFEDKIKIIDNAVTVARALGIKIPKVGVLSASEKINPKLSSSVEADMLTQYYAGRDDVIVGGPYALDNLISAEAAAHKAITGPVAGAADIIIFPGIEAGNTFYKTIVCLAGALPAGIIVGARCPIALTSRADTATAKFHAILLALVVNCETHNFSN